MLYVCVCVCVFECTENNQTIKKVLEIKCPLSLRHIGVKNSKNWTYLEYCTLKTTSKEYYQIQFYMWVYKLDSSILLVWTPIDYLQIEVNIDH